MFLCFFSSARRLTRFALVTGSSDVCSSDLRDVLGFDHATVGNELLQQWNLPPAICAAVGYHHMPMRAGANVPMAAVVHVADVMANAIAFGSSGMDAVPPLDESAWNTLGVSVSVNRPSLELVHQQLAETMADRKRRVEGKSG